jgi:hypothetical protein
MFSLPSQYEHHSDACKRRYDHRQKEIPKP